VRLWPGATPVQALLTALLGSGRQWPAATDLAAVQIRVPPATYEAHRHLAHPAGTFEALLSFHYVAAMSLRHGRFDIDLAGPAHCGDPETRAFIDEHIFFLADPAIPRGGAGISVTDKGGDTAGIAAEHALGTPRNPATRAQIEGKFLLGAGRRLGSAPSKELLTDLNGLDGVTDCAELVRRSRQISSG
jgi:2-methylcitrate dehydratase PrpD